VIHVRSRLAGGSYAAGDVAKEWMPAFAEHFPVKLYWFLKHGYRPHEWQAVFHASSAIYDGNIRKLVRFRHLVAGRRGGKTYSAAWEVLFYCLHPTEFHRDAHGEENGRPLMVYLLAKDHKLGRAQNDTFMEVIIKAGLTKGRDYEYNKTEKIYTFYGPDGNATSHVEVRSADDPQSLRGHGLDILWIDESAMVPSNEAWGVVRPALSDRIGLLITTTTPKGKNWFYEEFWSAKALTDPYQARVEYTSIDNPYFPRIEWDYARDNMHPVIFAQEYLASFEAMTGLTLLGEWLKYYTLSKRTDPNTDSITVPRDNDGRMALRTFIGVDPAISMKETADHFAMALIGLTRDNSQAFLLDTFVGRLGFPDQLDKIREWYLKHRPEGIGIESVAYQKALADMAARMEGLPPIVPVFSKGKKNDRLISMSPLFKIGKVRIHQSQHDFIEQWLNFDGAKTDQEDDILDAVEIALGRAGVLLPQMPHESNFDERRPGSIHDEARLQLIARRNQEAYHPDLGSEA
jgi:phage terminase large subunit-like protein